MTTQTSIASQVASAFSFSVDKFPLTGPEGMRTPFYGLFRSDNCEVVHDKSVSSDYHPHTTDDVVTLVESAQSVFGECKPRCHFSKGHYVDLMPSKSDRLDVYGTADSVWPRLQISAGYNGKPFQFFLGTYRDLCKNMHIFRSVSGTSFSFRHDGNLRDNMEELIGCLTSLKEGWSNLKDTIVRMENTKVSLSEFMTKIYGDGRELEKAKLTRHENRTAKIVRRVINEQNRSGRNSMVASDDTVTAWEAFNAIQGFVQHDQSRRGNVNSFDRELKANDSQEVRMAEAFAVNLSA
jgi:hypothetical protein